MGKNHQDREHRPAVGSVNARETMLHAKAYRTLDGRRAEVHKQVECESPDFSSRAIPAANPANGRVKGTGRAGDIGENGEGEFIEREIDRKSDKNGLQHQQGNARHSLRRNATPTSRYRAANGVYRATLEAAGFPRQDARSEESLVGAMPANASAWSAELSEQHALLRSLASAAAEAVDARTAGGLAAACVPVALRMSPQHFAALRPAIPLLVVGCQSLARRLHRSQRQGRLRQLPEALSHAIDCLIEQTSAGPLRRVDVARAMSRAAAGLCKSMAATQSTPQQVNEPWN
jgi:hypothetical protein